MYIKCVGKKMKTADVEEQNKERNYYIKASQLPHDKRLKSEKRTKRA